ncbi:cyclic nucleotide-binding domain-containing protein [Leuconostoc carnosum]|nr:MULTISPECIES: cyclic nucleotide-binding domain-containing protein [Leuconostoc]KAA8325301.1 cyclic nucleotide-binding domain-containing protein [Leuconostoc carnosum]KAA8359525.1 cyclic nucleotide-binding domain-containing protein [Leuconostoc carnosum]KAA8365099.1 cyclic nucleotide-binding domain-containing protein [Leuconostoc carnosum]KAA8367469.1 cyclic nucleotide-binding domain-containing protein [Leuconostoc carnosum]KAA8372662.1 cyclic nucleotide-binding domain-containing protein [Le
MIDDLMIDKYKLSFLPQEVLVGSHICYFENTEIIMTSEQIKNSATLYYLVEGHAKVTFLSQEGTMSLIQFFYPKDWIGELELNGVTTHSKQVISIGKTRCIGIPQSLVQKYLLNNVVYLQNINHYLANKVLKRTNWMIVHKSYAFKYRLATFILDDSYEDRYSEPHRLVMEYLGVSYRHLLYTYKKFEEDGLIYKLSRNKYQIDSKKLRLLYIDA